MLRLSFLSSVIPLILAGGAAHEWTSASARQCFAAPAVRAVAFTADPLAATVRVQVVKSAELADLAIADDTETTGTPGCGVLQAAQLVSLSAQPGPGDPVVYLTREADADYRIYVNSTKISAEQTAALIVGARGGQKRLAGQLANAEPTGSISR